VPIVLATYPLLVGFEGAEVLFNVVFFTVIVSAVLQGWTLPPVARWLGLQVEAPPQAPVSLEITSLRDVDGDIVEYTVTPESRAADRHVRDLRLPDGAVVAMLVRAGEIIPPRGSTIVRAGDHVFLVMRPGLRPLVDRIFRRQLAPEPIPSDIEFPLRGDTTVAELAEFYGIQLDEAPDMSLHEVMAGRFRSVTTGSRLRLGEVDLVARVVVDGTVEQVGLAIRVERGA
jgi:potassium/hydrogen antiporter